VPVGSPTVQATSQQPVGLQKFGCQSIGCLDASWSTSYWPVWYMRVATTSDYSAIDKKLANHKLLELIFDRHPLSTRCRQKTFFFHWICSSCFGFQFGSFCWWGAKDVMRLQWHIVKTDNTLGTNPLETHCVSQTFYKMFWNVYHRWKGYFEKRSKLKAKARAADPMEKECLLTTPGAERASPVGWNSKKNAKYIFRASSWS